MNSYIVRIYREEPDNPNTLVGIVEAVESREKKAFTNLDELWEIMNPSRCGTKKSAEGTTADNAETV